MTDRRDLTTGPVRLRLVRFASPLVLGIVASLSTALADAYFLGKLGLAPLAAISFAFPVAFAIMSLAIGLGAGTSSVVARAIGRRDDTRTARRATDSLVLALLLGMVIAGLALPFVRPLFALLGAEGAVLDQVEIYMRIWFWSLPILVVAQVGGSIMRAGGDTLVPSVLMIGSALINVALDPLLIFGGWGIPAMGIEGAAWAGFIGRAAMLLGIPVLIFRDRLIDLAIPPLADLVESWREILRIGVPAALGNAVNPVGISIVTGILAHDGTATVAAFGVATRLESFACIPMLALSGAIGPIAGQNWGAGRHDRVREALGFAFMLCLGWSVAMAAVFAIAGGWLAGLFTDAPGVAAVSQLYLWIVPLTLVGYGVTIVAAGCLNALGRSGLGLALYLVRTAALYIPLAALAAFLFDEAGVFAAIALTNMVAGVAIYLLSFRWLDAMIARDTARQE